MDYFLTTKNEKPKNELELCNSFSSKSELVLTEEEYQRLCEARQKALDDFSRVEFGGGILPLLVKTFHRSKYINRENYCYMLEELQRVFYYFRGECDGLCSDAELLAYMRKAFDGEASGNIEFLAGTSMERFCMKLRGRRNEYLD